MHVLLKPKDPVMATVRAQPANRRRSPAFPDSQAAAFAAQSVPRANRNSAQPDLVPAPELTSDPAELSRARVTVDGKFFRLGGRKFHPKGVTYGPFAPNAAGEPFPEPDQVEADLDLIADLGANLVRLYFAPPRWFLDAIHRRGIKALVDVPWNKHQCFLDSAAQREAARRTVREAAKKCAVHPAVFAVSVANEIPADIVRWSGAQAVGEFLDELVAEVKSVDRELLCTFGNFPPTEFLRARSVDFWCWNVYLHFRRPFENYLARLQMLADTKPLVLGEFGIDSLRESEEQQAEILGWQVEAAFRSGCAGTIIFSFTDDWFQAGEAVTGWTFGLVGRDRHPKPAFAAVKRQFALAPYFPLPQAPRVSVVVASYNGAATLRACLQSLERLNYPDFEVILVDDGSTDETESIAALFPSVRYFRQDQNRGLSVARNVGITASTGEIVAFTDSDCRADEDWLRYLVGDLLNSRCAGIGGHNFLPPDDSPTAACVMVSPGGPAHVMLTDRVAEHIPGCNMAFYRWALDSIGGFDPMFWKAGDDVDVCWRLQQRGYRLGFSPAGFVWHYRRNTVRAYLRQQAGYGDAEALLERRHPENFNRFGGSMWQGRIYSPAKYGVRLSRSIIYHGRFGTAFFQSIYAAPPSLMLAVATGLEYHALITLPMLVLGSVVPVLTAFGCGSLLFSVALCILAASQAELPHCKRRFWSRPLVALLFFLQPIVRGWARHRGHLRGQQRSPAARESLDSLSLEGRESDLGQLLYWSEREVDRMAFLARLIERLDERGWPNKPDTGWSPHDVEIFGPRWASIHLTTAAEYYRSGHKIIRCRLRARWSFPARALFWSVAGTLLVVIGYVGKNSPAPTRWWIWSLLAVLPLLAGWLNSAKRDLLRLIATFVDKLAREFELVRLDPEDVSRRMNPPPADT